MPAFLLVSFNGIRRFFTTSILENYQNDPITFEVASSDFLNSCVVFGIFKPKRVLFARKLIRVSKLHQNILYNLFDLSHIFGNYTIIPCISGPLFMKLKMRNKPKIWKNYQMDDANVKHAIFHVWHFLGFVCHVSINISHHFFSNILPQFKRCPMNNRT